MSREPDLEIRPLGPHLGGEVSGLDVREIGRTMPVDTIREALHEHQLLCFRDQDLAPGDLADFTRVFGEPLPHVLQQFSLPRHPEIYVLSNIVEDGKPIGNAREGFGWHTDLAYMARPAAYTILFGLEVPEEGGDTWFASFYRMWDALDDAEQARLRRLQGRYSYIHLYSQRKGVAPLTEEQKARTPDVRHPFARLHPETGREGLYIGGDDFIAVEDSDAPEADFTRLWELFRETTERFRYVHEWRPRDLLVWDNRGLAHTATDYDTERYRRLIWRTSVLGEVPIGATDK